MAKANPKKQLAEILFMENNMSQKEIADMLGTTQVSVSKWSKAGDWDHKRAVNALSPDTLIRQYYQLSKDINDLIKKEERTATSGEADALLKFAAAIEKLDKKVNPSIVTAVFMRFNNYLKLLNLPLAKELIKYQMPYLESLINPER
jgi:predicted transcriptional regulator